MVRGRDIVVVCVCLCIQSSKIPMLSDWFVREGDGGGLHVCM